MNNVLRNITISLFAATVAFAQPAKIIEKKDEKLEKIVDDYYKGNITLSDALTSLKIVLYEIKAKL